MTNCEEIQVFKGGVCIAESLGKCKGCADKFFNDLEQEGFKGLRIDENGIKHFGEKNK